MQPTTSPSSSFWRLLMMCLLVYSQYGDTLTTLIIIDYFWLLLIIIVRSSGEYHWFLFLCTLSVWRQPDHIQPSPTSKGLQNQIHWQRIHSLQGVSLKLLTFKEFLQTGGDNFKLTFKVFFFDPGMCLAELWNPMIETRSLHWGFKANDCLYIFVWCCLYTVLIFSMLYVYTKYVS